MSPQVEQRDEPRHEAPTGASPGALLSGSIGFLRSKLGFITSSGFAEALRPLGIDPGHFALLRIVDSVDGPSQQWLCDELSIPPSRMVGLIDDLESRGLVERRRGAVDRRVNELFLTVDGRGVLARARETAAVWEEHMCAVLTSEEREHLGALLVRLAASHGLPVGVHPGLQRSTPA
jgi:DNA-binding MarR family transcriptional regulator